MPSSFPDEELGSELHRLGFEVVEGLLSEPSTSAFAL